MNSLKTEYTSTSSNNLTNLFVVLSFLILAPTFIWISQMDVFWKILLSILILIALVISILFFRKNSFQANFYNSHLTIKYNYINKVIDIPYQNIQKIRYSSLSKTKDTNTIFFLEKGISKSLKISTIANDDRFIDFVKWIKSKNDKIEVFAFPSDHILNHKLQKIYGFKYREGQSK